MARNASSIIIIAASNYNYYKPSAALALLRTDLHESRHKWWGSVIICLQCYNNSICTVYGYVCIHPCMHASVSLRVCACMHMCMCLHVSVHNIRRSSCFRLVQPLSRSSILVKEGGGGGGGGGWQDSR